MLLTILVAVPLLAVAVWVGSSMASIAFTVIGYLMRSFFASTLEEKDKRKPKEVGNRKYLLIVFFPLTIYILLGTTLLSLVYKVEQLAKWLSGYSILSSEVRHDFEPIEWHMKSIWLTIAFPAVGIYLGIAATLLLVGAFLDAVLRLIYDQILMPFWWALKTIWRWTIEVVQWIRDVILDVWYWTREAVEAVWFWTLDAIAEVWASLTGTS